MYVGSGSLASRFIYRISLDGGMIETFVTITEAAYATGMWVDAGSRLLYWIQTNSRIKRTSVDRESADYGVIDEVSLTAEDREWSGLVVDSRATPATLYFSELGEGVAYAHQWRSTVDEFFFNWEFMYNPVALALDTARDRLLFSDADSRYVAAIDLRAARPIDTIQAVIASDLVRPAGITVDSAGEFLYLLEEGQASARPPVYPRLSRRSLSGSAGNWTVSVEGKPQGLSLMSAAKAEAAKCSVTTTGHILIP